MDEFTRTERESEELRREDRWMKEERFAEAPTMKLWDVRVYSGEGGQCPRVRRYRVQASTPEDARLMAFVLDGGWATQDAVNRGEVEDMDDGAIQLAITWTDEPKNVLDSNCTPSE